METSLSSTQTLNPFRIIFTALQSSNVLRIPLKLVKYTTILSSAPSNRNNIPDSHPNFEPERASEPNLEGSKPNFEAERGSEPNLEAARGSEPNFEAKRGSDFADSFGDDSNRLQSFFTILPRSDDFMDSTEP